MVDFQAVETAALGKHEMDWIQARCLCPGCPAYPEEDRGQKKTYCLRGDSPHKESIQPKDCLCEMCEIYKGGKLYGTNFFCLEGAALKKGLRNVLQGHPISKLVHEHEAPAPTVFVSSGLDVHKARDGRNDAAP